MLDSGGDAVLVGIVAACYAIPTLLLRPAIGRWIDGHGHGGIQRWGGVLIASAPLVYLISPAAVVAAVRFVHGVGWAMYGTANSVVLARLAPLARRGAVSAYFNIMFAVGFLVGPPLGISLYASMGPMAPFLLASAVGVVALATALALARTTQAMIPKNRPESHSAASGQPGALRSAAAYGRGVLTIEPAAASTMLITGLVQSSQVLFLAFAPVYARAIGAPVEPLAAYFIVYAILLGGGQLVMGGLSDRVGRRRAMAVGITLASAGLLTALVPAGLSSFVVGGALVALGSAIVQPAVTAAAMDRAPEGRVGATMATFSMGFQLGAGGGGAAWGIIIGTLGFPWPFAAALVAKLAALALVLREADRPVRPLPAVPDQG